jgi:hypothetical protein
LAPDAPASLWRQAKIGLFPQRPDLADSDDACISLLGLPSFLQATSGNPGISAILPLLSTETHASKWFFPREITILQRADSV